uniref:DUF4440 domain-containing protein n=1 Tax=Nonomuraea bangladeshensis TaxID=404385 RepID=UPI003F493EEA
MTGTDRDLTDAVRAEVVRHHQVIEQWLAGRAPRAAFDRFSAAHAPGFTMVAPDGRLLSRGDVLAEVEPAYGGRPDARIEIRAVAVVTTAPGLVVARYEEWQDDEGRLATVVLQDGWRWLHLHETWCESSGPGPDGQALAAARQRARILRSSASPCQAASSGIAYGSQIS